MSRLELDPAQLADAMSRAHMTRHEVESELAKFVQWRRRHRLRGDWQESWLLWLDHVVADRVPQPRVPDYVPTDWHLNARDREVGRAGVAYARQQLRARNERA